MKKVIFVFMSVFLLTSCDIAGTNYQDLDIESKNDQTETCQDGYALQLGECVKIEDSNDDKCVSGYEWNTETRMCDKIELPTCEQGFVLVDGVCERFVLNPAHLDMDAGYDTWYLEDMVYEYFILQFEELETGYGRYYLEYKKRDESTAHYEQSTYTNYVGHYQLERSPGPTYDWEIWDYKYVNGMLSLYSAKHTECTEDYSYCEEVYHQVESQSLKHYIE